MQKITIGIAALIVLILAVLMFFTLLNGSKSTTTSSTPTTISTTTSTVSTTSTSTAASTSTTTATTTIANAPHTVGGDFPCGEYQTVNAGGSINCGLFRAELNALGQPDNSIYPAIMSIYYNEVLINNVAIYQSTSPTVFNTSSDNLYVVVNQTNSNNPSSAIIQIYQTQQINLSVILITDAQTCIIGNSYTGGGNPLTIQYTDNNVVAQQFQNDASFAAVRQSDLTSYSYTVEDCLDLAMSSQEIQHAKDQVDIFVGKAFAYSDGAIMLVPTYYEYQGEINMSGYGSGFWLSPNNIPRSLVAQIGSDAGFVIAFMDTRDSTKLVSYPFNYGGLTFGSDYGLSGAGYSFIPLAWWSGDSTSWTYPLHEWLHQLNSALQQGTGVQDIYNNNFPQSLCGNASSNPWSWFPSADCAQIDPGFPACAYNYGNWSAYCNAFPSVNEMDCGQVWDKYILHVHYPKGIRLLPNHCNDGLQDFGETDIDQGGIDYARFCR